ncbi:hypothetical protein B0H10DRAFT_2193132 [Mycena sp. CBHHK59/15]|nr:hypothetical protein B0H10DRAFT_2193132 [Mycena sp. CBHHK59/15]
MGADAVFATSLIHMTPSNPESVVHRLLTATANLSSGPAHLSTLHSSLLNDPQLQSKWREPELEAQISHRQQYLEHKESTLIGRKEQGFLMREVPLGLVLVQDRLRHRRRFRGGKMQRQRSGARRRNPHGIAPSDVDEAAKTKLSGRSSATFAWLQAFSPQTRSLNLQTRISTIMTNDSTRPTTWKILCANCC